MRAKKSDIMNRDKFIVSSKTPRIKEGYPDICWMDIGVDKLHEASKKKAVYTFLFELSGTERYSYTYSAAELLKVFEEKKVRIKKSRMGGEYSFFLEYTTGTLLHSLSHVGEPENVICKLIPESQSDIILNAEEQLQAVLDSLSYNPLPLLVARTALWAQREEHEDCKKTVNGETIYAKHPHVRRKQVGEERGKNENGEEYLDDNSYPNAQMKASLKKRHRIPKGYETCHIWEKTCYDPRYHTCYANLVLLPRAIAALSDHNDNIRDILKYRAYKLFGFWPDEKKPRPTDPPENYPKEEEWRKD